MDKLKEYLKDDADLEKVKAAVEELNKDAVEKHLSGLNKSDATKLMNDNKSLKSVFDAGVAKALDTFKEKTLPGLVEDEVTKRNPPETEEQKQIRQLREQIEQERKERNKEKQINLAYSIAKEFENEKGIKIPDKMLRRYIGANEEETRTNIEELVEEYEAPIKTSVESEIAKRFKGDPPKSGDPTKKKIEEYTEDELAALEKTNPIKLDELIAEQNIRHKVIEPPKKEK